MPAMSAWYADPAGPRRTVIDGVPFHVVTAAQVVSQVRESLARGDGGRIITPNVDIMRQAADSPAVREMISDASLVVADGMPVIWASRIAGRRRRARRLPERIAGADLVWSLSQVCAEDGRRIFVVGGAPAEDGRPAGAQRAAAVLSIRYRGLRVAGSCSPAYGFDRDPRQWAAVCAEVIDAKPDLVFVGVGFPRQELLINALRPELPNTWFLGCGASVDFVVGDRRRAPRLMRRTGLEWAYRLAQEPRRLGPRYLRTDLPYAVHLLGRAARSRLAIGLRPARVEPDQSAPRPGPDHPGAVSK
jgi:N-acetylglucosaminyldiphosphoundecaprenol N-acetyl-beta-D-mannosaminyltransferase